MKLHHISLRTTDFDRAVAFYQALGLQPALYWQPEGEKACLLKMEHDYLEIFGPAQPGEPAAPPEGALLHLAFASQNCPADYTRALAAGAAPLLPPTFVTVPSEPPLPLQIAFVTGPSGEKIEFFQQLGD